jgi:hypothetical protein
MAANFKKSVCMSFSFDFVDYFIDNSIFVNDKSRSVNSIVFFSHKFLGPQTPKASITDLSSSANNGEIVFFLNLACFACASALLLEAHSYSL